MTQIKKIEKIEYKGDGKYYWREQLMTKIDELCEAVNSLLSKKEGDFIPPTMRNSKFVADFDDSPPPSKESWQKELAKNWFWNKLEPMDRFTLLTEVENLLTTQREEWVERVRNRVNNVLSSKYAGIERINPILERAILYCLSDEYDDSPKTNIQRFF